MSRNRLAELRQAAHLDSMAAEKSSHDKNPSGAMAEVRQRKSTNRVMSTEGRDELEESVDSQATKMRRGLHEQFEPLSTLAQGLQQDASHLKQSQEMILTQIRVTEEDWEKLRAIQQEMKRKIRLMKTKLNEIQTVHFEENTETYRLLKANLTLEFKRKIVSLSDGIHEMEDTFMSRLQRRNKAVSRAIGGEEAKDVEELDNYNNFNPQLSKTGAFMMEMMHTEEERKRLELIEDRQKEILDLEASMRALLELFEDVKDLVMEQQEGVDQIEGNVEQASEDIIEAVIALKQAKKYKKFSRKLKVGLAVLCIATAGVAAIVLAVKFV